MAITGLLLVACSDDAGDGNTETDAGPEPEPEPPIDGGPEPTADAGPEPESDAGPEPEVDGGGDRPVDAGPLQDAGPLTDAGRDAGSPPEDSGAPCLTGEKFCDGDVLMGCEDGHWVFERDCRLEGQTCDPFFGGLPRCTDPIDSGAEIQIPALRAFTLGEATELGARARELQVVTVEGESTRVGWSMVNASCEDRCVALEYALAVLATATNDDPVVMAEAELTPEAVLDVAERGADVVASINVAGPLVTEQSLWLPDGSAVSGDPEHYFWPYHHGAVLLVDRALRVLDLSLGDEPVIIEEWTSGFVDPSIECVPMDEEEFQEVWIYWNAAFNNFVPGERPARPCGYTITPIFTFRWDQEPLTDFVRTAPRTMVVQFGGLESLLGLHGVELLPEQVPHVLSSYTPLSEAEVCEWNDLVFCSL